MTTPPPAGMLSSPENSIFQNSRLKKLTIGRYTSSAHCGSMPGIVVCRETDFFDGNVSKLFKIVCALLTIHPTSGAALGSAAVSVRLRRLGSAAGCEARLRLAVNVCKKKGAMPLVRPLADRAEPEPGA